MTYLEKISFDKKSWYQLEWEDVEFKTLEDAIRHCKTIEEVEKTITETFPNSNLKLSLI